MSMVFGWSCEGKINRMTLRECAKYMGIDYHTIGKGLKQGRFPWGYAIKTSENHWVYFINARKFAEIEGVRI